MTAERSIKAYFYIKRLSHWMEEFQYNEDDLQVLSQGSTPRTSTPYNKKTIKVLVLFLQTFTFLNPYIKINRKLITFYNNK